MNTGTRCLRGWTSLVGAAVLFCGAVDIRILKAADQDPAWETTHKEVALIRVLEKGEAGSLNNFCVNTDGNLLACCGASRKSPGAVKVFSPDGKLLKTWSLEAAPQAICVDADGTIYAGGNGRVFKLNQEGKVLAGIDSPGMSDKSELPKEIENSIRKSLKKKSPAEVDQAIANYKIQMRQNLKGINGIAVTSQDVFVTCHSPSDFGYTVYRLDRDLQNPALIIKGLSGCCDQMDVQAHDGKVWIPHNAKHKVECYDRDGKKLLEFGKYDRKAAEGFGGCCEPKNIRIAANGEIFAAESGEPICIKRFSPEGKFLGVVAVPHYETGCVRVTVDMSKDGKTFYILDPSGNAIHVLGPKG